MPAAPVTPAEPASAFGLSGAALYAAWRAHDARFDGRLFVGVTSTGIYCRPVCRVRLPQPAHCRFFDHAAAAEAAGYRPCLRCRPELAPGLSLVDSPQALAHQAARLIDAAVAEGRALPMPVLAARLGITDRHLRRIFRQAHGVTPLDWLATRRLLQAKQLLTDTTLPVTEVALASGFASLRRFHAAFTQRYRLQPGALRRAARDAVDDGRQAHLGPLRLAFRPPYDREGVLAFLRRRAVPGLEAVTDDGEIRRTLRLAHGQAMVSGWTSARFGDGRQELQVVVDSALAPVLGGVLQAWRRWLDLDAEPQAIAHALDTAGLAVRAGLRLPTAPEGFEAAVRVILGQQVSVAAARTFTARLVQAFGSPVATPWPGVDRAFPDAATVAGAEPAALGRLGIVRQRVQALQALSRAVAEGRLQLHPDAPLEPTLQALRALPGIGEWTTQLVALRALGWPDAFPAGDLAVRAALGSPGCPATEAMAARAAERWRPWRGYALMQLWLDLENPT